MSCHRPTHATFGLMIALSGLASVAAACQGDDPPLDLPPPHGPAGGNTDASTDAGAADGPAAADSTDGDSDAASASACVTSIVAGANTSCALLDDGSLWCWGLLAHELGKRPPGPGIPNDDTPPPPARMPAAGDHVLQAGLSLGSACSLDADQGVRCWGWLHGVSGMGAAELTPVANPLQVDGLGDGAVDLTAGGYHTCARKADGTLWCWGANWAGQLGDQSVPSAAITQIKGPVPVRDLGTSVVQASASAIGTHTCAVTADGKLWCWGSNEKGELGVGVTSELSPRPLQVAALGELARQVSVGSHASCAVTLGGAVSCWGDNTAGYLGVGTLDSPVVSPRSVPSLAGGVKRVVLGDEHACALRDDSTLWCWGANRSGQVGNGTVGAGPDVVVNDPVQVAALGANVVDVALGSRHTCALTKQGDVYCWGADYDGQLGTVHEPVEAGAFASGTPSRVALASCGHAGSPVTAPDASVGDSGVDDAEAGGVEAGDAQTLEMPRCATEIETGAKHSCALLADESTWCWGDNQLGQVGLGHSFSPVSRPARTSVAGASILAAGNYHTCVAGGNGEVRCWGMADSGQLGTTSTEPYSTQPVDVPAPGVAFHGLSAGAYFTCARDAQDTAWCWGVDPAFDYGASVAPAVVGGLPSPLAGLDVGDRHACALTTAGEPWCWGLGYGGALGLGVAFSTGEWVPPTQLTVLGAGVRRISAGSTFTCAIDASAQLWCWGQNYGGTSGNGTQGNVELAPVLVEALGTGVVDVSAGSTHVCATRDDGTLWCWGANHHGAIGIGTIPSMQEPWNELFPLEVTGLPVQSTSVSCGDGHTCARGMDGSVWCWGWNDAGQVGDGTLGEDKASPVQVVAPCL